MRAPDLERLARILRRTLLVVLLTPFAAAGLLTLVDAYRSRGKRPRPFPITPPRSIDVGEGTITPYTFGKDLYADMLAAIEGAKRQVLLETYIWKGDATGQRFKNALIQDLTEQMKGAAAELQFEVAARLRDEIGDLKKELRQMMEATK